MRSECPTCSESFSSEGGMKTHHKRIHGESIAGVSVVCEVCGDEYRVRPCREERARFCSEDCRNKKFEEEYAGEKNPQYDESGRMVECPECGDSFRLAPWEIKEGREYCSKACADNGRKTISSTECVICGEEFETHEPDRRKTCSMECNKIQISKRQQEDDHWNWRGGISNSYGYQWSIVSDTIREKFNNTCQVCGRVGEDKRLSVHHIIPVRKFEKEKDAHIEENLVLLCRSCHGYVEWNWSTEDQIERFNRDTDELPDTE